MMINVLTGAERVRKRPAVIFGSQGIEGAETAVKMLLDIFATEALLGHCKSMAITQNNGQITVACDDRGLYLGQDLPQPQDVWKNVFCELYLSPRSGPTEQEYHFELFDTTCGSLWGDEDIPDTVFLPDTYGTNDLCMVQYASRDMHVTVVRDGIRSVLDFHGGEPVGEPRQEPTADKNGTTISFSLDPEVFSETVPASAFFVERMKTYAMLIPGLRTHYTDNTTGEEVSFCFPEGIAGYVRERASDPVAPLFTHQICAEGRDRYDRRPYRAEVKAAVCFVPRGGEQFCYHNLRHLKYGGTHLQAFKERLCEQLNAQFATYIRERTGDPEGDILEQELDDHLYLVLETWCSRYSTQWENGNQRSIRNVMIKDMAHDLLRVEFSNYIYGHRIQLQALIDAILAAR